MTNWFPDKIIIANDVIRLAEMISDRRPSLLGIDGGPGAGKSHLARALSSKLGWRHVDLDDLLDGSGRPFVSQIRPATLEAAIADRPVIVSGICLLAALRLVFARPDLLVYVARITREGLPGDLELRDEDLEPERACERHVSSSKLWAEVRAYHRSHRPITAAEAVFTVPEPAL